MKKPRSQRRKGEAYEAYLPPGDQSRYFVLAYSVRLVSQAGKCVPTLLNCLRRHAAGTSPTCVRKNLEK